MLGSLDAFIVNTAMPRVLAELGQPVLYAWIASAFILAQIVGLSVGGAWKDRSGLRMPFSVSVVVFGVGSLLCAFAPSMPLLVAFRVFQGLGGGGITAICFAAAADYPDGLRLRMFGLFTSVWGVVSLVAPLLGGVLTDAFGWRSIFLVNVPLCAIVLLLAIRGFGSRPGDHRRPLPIFRSVLLAAATGGITAAPSASLEVAVPLFAFGLLCGWLFLRQEKKAEVPVIPLDTWRGRGPVGSSMLATVFYTGSFIPGAVFLPLYLQELRGESATQVGLLLTIGGMMWTVGSLIAAHAHGQWAMRLVRGGALLIALGGLAVAFQAAVGTLPLILMYVAWAAAGCGVGLGVLHLLNWAIVYSPPSEAGSVSGAVQTIRLVGSAAGAALMGAILQAIGADAAHLRTSIIVIFIVVAAFGLWPATFGRPRLDEPYRIRQASPNE